MPFIILIHVIASPAGCGPPSPRRDWSPKETSQAAAWLPRTRRRAPAYLCARPVATHNRPRADPLTAEADRDRRPRLNLGNTVNARDKSSD